MYVDESIEMNYLKVFSPIGFEQQREKVLGTKTKLVELRGTQDISPIYYDSVKHLFYYPKEALWEAEQLPRLMIIGKPLLRWKAELQALYDPWSGKEYCGFEKVADFESKRKKTLEELKPLEVDEEVRKISTMVKGGEHIPGSTHHISLLLALDVCCTLLLNVSSNVRARTPCKPSHSNSFTESVPPPRSLIRI